MAVNNNYPAPPLQIKFDLPTLRLVVQSLAKAIIGKTNNVGTVTLAASATSTTVDNTLCNANSAILFQPTTAHAAADFGSLYAVAGDGSFVIHHANNANTDRTFQYVIVG